MPKFQRLDKVMKVGGDYTLPGVVVAVIEKVDGQIRYVVEHTPYGFLHIYNEKQLQCREETV